MNRKKTIGYVSAANPFTDRKAWSGLIYKIREAIELSGYEVRWIPYTKDSKSIIYQKVKLKLKHLLGGGKYLSGVHNPTIAKLYAKSIKTKNLERCDYLFFPGGAQISLFLENNNIPIINYTDATVQCMKDYYWIGFNHKSIKMAENLETATAQQCLFNIRSSQWAKNSLINDCNADPSKCVVLEFGANIDNEDIKPIKPYSGGQLNVLFSGVAWDRKGGAIAVETVKKLRNRGINARLIVVGPKNIPSECQNVDYVDFVGFLNKNDRNDYIKYIKLFRESHVFLLPTKAECAGVVFSEASSFGIPCYTYATGGTTNYVINGINGQTIELGNGADAFADAIYDDLSKDHITDFSQNALHLYSERLSWEAWSRRFRELLENEKNS